MRVAEPAVSVRVVKAPPAPAVPPLVSDAPEPEPELEAPLAPGPRVVVKVVAWPTTEESARGC